jgi:hypothetical protein
MLSPCSPGKGPLNRFDLYAIDLERLQYGDHLSFNKFRRNPMVARCAPLDHFLCLFQGERLSLLRLGGIMTKNASEREFLIIWAVDAGANLDLQKTAIASIKALWKT